MVLKNMVVPDESARILSMVTHVPMFDQSWAG